MSFCIRSWERYNNIVYEKKLGWQESHQVYDAKLVITQEISIPIVVKFVPEPIFCHELRLLRRLARYDGKNFCIPNPFLLPGEDPVNTNKGLITTIGFTVEEDKEHPIGIIFPKFTTSLGDILGSTLLQEKSFVEHLFKSCLAGLRNLHAWGFRHNDVKPDNILICKETCEVVLSDFGVADSGIRLVKSSQSTYVRCPEQKEDAYTAQDDVYALGSIIKALSRTYDGLPVFFNCDDKIPVILDRDTERGVVCTCEVILTEDIVVTEPAIPQETLDAIFENKTTSFELFRKFCPPSMKMGKCSFALAKPIPLPVRSLFERFFLREFNSRESKYIERFERFDEIVVKQFKLDIEVVEWFFSMLFTSDNFFTQCI